jgi:multiple sugar transport system substrate-binding protein
MPDWVKQQIDFEDLVAYLKPPVGTWNGKQYRVTIDGDCHNFNYRTDVFADETLAQQWKEAGNQGEWGVPKTWQQVQAVTKFLKGKQVNGQDIYGYLMRPSRGAVSGSTSWRAARPPTPSTRTTRPGCSTRIR